MNHTPNLGLQQPQYVDPADIMEINRAMDTIDMWAEQADIALSNKINKGTPQKIQMPYSSGFIASSGHLSSYVKTGENVVVVNFAVETQSGNPIGTHVSIATLPQGFRPSSIAVSSGTSTTGIVGFVTVDPNGDVRISTDGNVLVVYATIVFVAA